ncbi:hypothetical protein O7623_27605 [Solwaraspora sp. WMMD791]|uniref:hypothetical protein n=1 Tax=Solwaraspora sp. WMMD791 TaxID=3016086 RepID=UPI00249B7BCA|nr:hypothetical protein [Solwaraspora sp. WMMD791]WFE26984.1 hypothetical protein O7623_27605 [Solwaraspora sp. WMMD791]
MTAPPAPAAPTASHAPAGPATRPWLRRLLPHLVWEALLLLLVLAVAALIAARADVLGNPGLLFNIAGLGLLATGLALSLRTGTPNLAAPALASLSGVSYVALLDAGWSMVPAAAVGVIVVVTCGLILGLITGLTSVPAWAVSVAGLAGAAAVVLAVTDGQHIVIRNAGAPTTGVATVWLLLFGVTTLGGALLWQVPAVRALLSANRSDGAPGGWSARRLVGAVVGFAGSSLLAALSGLVVATSMRAAGPTGADLSRLALGLAVVLLGGVSAFGRRGGIAGTLLATILLVLVSTALAVEDAPIWISIGLVPAVAITIGLLVGRLLDFLSGPEPAGPVPGR